MDRTTLKAFNVILTSLGLAIIFNWLFFYKLIGISVLIFTLFLLGAVFVLYWHQRSIFRKNWWLVPPLLFFALIPSIHASEFLVFLNICAILGLLMLLAQGLIGLPAPVLKLRDYFSLLLQGPLRMLGRALFTIAKVGQVHSEEKNRDLWLRVLKGTIMALPILIIFGLLFSQADLVFSQLLNRFLTVSISERTAQYLTLLLFAFVAALSFLSYITFPKETSSTAFPESRRTALPPGRGIEVLVFLGLISLLFLVFIVFQVTYLFGGEMNIVNAGFTYAEYARRGFWELLAVAILSLLILFACDKYTDSESTKDKRFLIPALVLIVEVIIVIVSAFKRLSLYIDAYSLTAPRFYAATFIMLLSVLFILLAIKLIKAKPEQFFTFGTLLTLIIFLVVINVINPDAFIATSNTKRFYRTGLIDIQHIGLLSTDAISQKLEMLHKLEGENKALLQDILSNEKAYLRTSSTAWQSANFSRARALRLLTGIGE